MAEGESGGQRNHVVENEGQIKRRKVRNRRNKKKTVTYTHIHTLELDCYCTVD